MQQIEHPQIESSRPIGVYDAGDAIALTLESMAHRKAAMLDNRAIMNLWGIPEIDDFVVPFWPGDYIFTMGLPSNGKSFTARMMALAVVNMLIDAQHTNRAVVWVTTEESVETVTTAWLAAISGVSSTDMLSGKLSRVHSVTVNAAVAEVASWPLYIIGHTLGNSKGPGHTTRRLTPHDIELCLDYIGQKKDIIYVTIDYLQRIGRPPHINSREEHIRLAVDWGRDLGNKFVTPINMVTQAKFAVSNYSVPMPTLEDSEWSSNAGQSADTMFSVYMPQTKPGVGEVLQYGPWKGLIIERGMLIVYVAKQKQGEAQKAFLLKAQPHLMKWEALEMKTEDLNNLGHTKKNDEPEQPDYMNSWGQTRVPYAE
jgi:replicative DNA helicase